MDHDERSKLRRTKKARRRKARQAADSDARLVARLNPGLGNPHEKAKALASLQKARGAGAGGKATGVETNAADGKGGLDVKEFSTSARFFAKLQEEATGEAKALADTAERERRGAGWQPRKRKKESDGRAAALML